MNDETLKEQIDTWIRQAYVNGSLDVNNPEPQGSDVCTELVWEAVLKDRERAVKEAKQAIQAHIDKRVNESNKELFKALRGIWSNPPKEYVEQGSYELFCKWNFDYAEFEYTLFRYRADESKQEISHGDLHWATVTARHLGIDVPKEVNK